MTAAQPDETRPDDTGPDEAARSAADAAGVRLAPLETAAQMQAASAIFAAVWGTTTEASPMTPQILRALGHSGNYVIGAFDGDVMVGASAAFVTAGDHRPALHSHITGLLPSARRRGAGRALKLHQRAWALVRGIPTVVWTFDPLVRRNARFNLVALGADITAYLPDFYGPITDAVNGGDESDRCVVTWELAGDRATAAAAGPLPRPDLNALRAEGARVVLAPDGDRPRTHPLAGDVRLAWVPEDVIALRAREPARALDWRRALRDVLAPSLDEGFAADAMTAEGWYVLRRP